MSFLSRLFGGSKSRLDELKQVVSKEPSSRQFLVLAEEYRKEGKLHEAIEILEQGLRTNPGYVTAQVSLGRTYLQLNLIEDAIRTFNAALKNDRENLVVIRQLIDSYMRKGDKVEAIKKLKLYRALKPGDREVEELIQQIAVELQAEKKEADLREKLRGDTRPGMIPSTTQGHRRSASGADEPLPPAVPIQPAVPVVTPPSPAAIVAPQPVRTETAPVPALVARPVPVPVEAIPPQPQPTQPKPVNQPGAAQASVQVARPAPLPAPPPPPLVSDVSLPPGWTPVPSSSLGDDLSGSFDDFAAEGASIEAEIQSGAFPLLHGAAAAPVAVVPVAPRAPLAAELASLPAPASSSTDIFEMTYDGSVPRESGPRLEDISLFEMPVSAPPAPPAPPPPQLRTAPVVPVVSALPVEPAPAPRVDVSVPDVFEAEPFAAATIAGAMQPTEFPVAAPAVWAAPEVSTVGSEPVLPADEELVPTSADAMPKEASQEAVVSPGESAAEYLASAESSGPMVTETLAELYARQGYLQEAREAYRLLADAELDAGRSRILLEKSQALADRMPGGKAADGLREWARACGVSSTEPVEDMTAVLTKLVSGPGIRSAVLTDLEGSPVATAGADGACMEILIAELSAFRKNIQRSREEVGMGDIDFFMIQAADGAAAVRSVSDDYSLILHVENGVPIGRVRYEAARAAGKLRPALL